MRKGRDGFYSRYVKRLLDIICSALAMIVFCWLYAILAVLVRVKLGSPVIYSAVRVGRDGQPFKLYKFRSMTNATDENGNLLPDTQRLTKYGRIIRAASLDELPEAWNIFKGDMSVIGPRPLPTVYMDYYTDEELHRHDVRPGLSGWAQVNGRNAISWDKKFAFDLEYIKNVSFIEDVKILFLTVKKVFVHEGIGQGEERPGSLHEIRKKREDSLKS